MLKKAVLSILLFTCLSGTAQTSKIILQVENVSVKKGGDVSSGIFIEKNFLKIGKQTYSKAEPANTSTVEIVFDNIPAGDYAFVAFQDFDRNDQLKTNFIGYPKEPVGFSNNAKIVFGPPSFNDAKVKIEAGKTVRVRIKLK